MSALAGAYALEPPPPRLPRRAPAVPARAALAGAAPLHLADSLHVLTCGSVDDGKSTLIGRLLWDAGALHSDQRQALQRSPKTAAGTPDFSLLVDGLVAEREQGITIDVAWRYFDTPARRLVIIDSPGHEQYTRNMATGASHADLAILLVDARAGVKAQTRRHAAILNLMCVEHVVLAVNKMDMVGWSEARFRAIEADFQAIARRFGFRDAIAVPVSAVLGDNIARPSAAMPWYDGPLLLDHLQTVEVRRARGNDEFRFPVQMVLRADPRLPRPRRHGGVRIDRDRRRGGRSRQRAPGAGQAHRHHGPGSRARRGRPGRGAATRHRHRRFARRRARLSGVARRQPSAASTRASSGSPTSRSVRPAAISSARRPISFPSPRPISLPTSTSKT